MSEKNTSSRDGARSRGRFGLGLALGALAAFIVARRLWARRRMPHAALWRRVLAEMESLMTSSLAGLRWIMPLLGRLPDPFAVFRRIVPLVVRFGFPPEGWGIEAVEDSEDCIAFNVRRCIYLDTLTSYGAPELTTLYCGGDDTLFAALPPSVTWERTMTLGRGDDHCNSAGVGPCRRGRCQAGPSDDRAGSRAC